jgi:hypothetical protein
VFGVCLSDPWDILAEAALTREAAELVAAWTRFTADFVSVSSLIMLLKQKIKVC